MKARLFRWLTTNYNPKPESRPFLERLEQKEIAGIRVSVAVLSDRESIECLGIRLARQGMQAVWIEIDNQSDHGQRLDRYSIDASYYTPLEAASVNHLSVGRRFLSFGILGWFFLVLLPRELICRLSFCSVHWSWSRLLSAGFWSVCCSGVVSAMSHRQVAQLHSPAMPWPWPELGAGPSHGPGPVPAPWALGLGAFFMGVPGPFT